MIQNIAVLLIIQFRHTVYEFQVLLCITNNSIKHQSFVYSIWSTSGLHLLLSGDIDHIGVYTASIYYININNIIDVGLHLLLYIYIWTTSIM